MFNKVWEKIKSFAIIVFALGTIASLLMFLAALAGYISGLLYISVIVFISCMILSWLIYGFAVLIENSDATLHVNERILELLEKKEQSNESNPIEVRIDNNEEFS